jgi:TP901 family phage tail tape measure protein
VSQLEELYVLLTADTIGFQKGMASAEASSKRLQAQNDLSVAGIGKFALGVGVAGLAVGAGLTKMAGTFQQQMLLVRTQAGDTTDNIAHLSQQVLQLAGSVGQSPDALAQGLFHLASAGFTGKTAMDMLTAGAKLAAVGQSDFETTMQAVIFTMRAGLPDIHNASDAVSMLNAIVGNGDMHMQDLASAMGSGILPVAAQFGVSMQSVGAALAFMTDRGTPADQATTRLRMSLSLMAAPTKLATKLLEDAGVGSAAATYQVNAMTEALHKGGVSTSQLADDLKQPDGILVALSDLKKHLDDAGVSASMQEALLSRAFGGGKSGGTIMELYGQLALLKQKYDQIGKSSGDFANAWTLQSQTFDQRTKDAAAAGQALAITWGNVLLPVGTQVMTFLGDTAQLLGGNATATANADKPAQAFASTLKDIGGFLSHDVLPPLETFGKWMVDHRQVAEGIGAALASWWAIDKIHGWVSAASGAFRTVAGLIPGLGGGGASPLSKLAPQDVFVTNWEMMAGGKVLPGLPGVGVGAAEGAGGATAVEEVAAMGGASGLATIAGVAATAALPALVALGIFAALTGKPLDPNGPLKPGWANSDTHVGSAGQHKPSGALGTGRGGGDLFHPAGTLGTQPMGSGLGQLPGGSPAQEMSDLAQMIKDGRITTQKQKDVFVKYWAAAAKASRDTFDRQNYIGEKLRDIGGSSAALAGQWLGQEGPTVKALLDISTKMGGVADKSDKMSVAMGVLRTGSENLAGSPVWLTTNTLNSIADNVHGMGTSVGGAAGDARLFAKYAQEAEQNIQDFQQSLAPLLKITKTAYSTGLGALRTELGGNLNANPTTLGTGPPAGYNPGGSGNGNGNVRVHVAGDLHIHGVQNAAQLFDELRNVGLSRQASGRIPGLWN